jgi:hypothetical protein
MGSQQVVPASILALDAVVNPRREDPLAPLQHASHPGLVERHPVLDAVAEVGEEGVGVVGVVLDNFLPQHPAVGVLQGLRQVPVEDGGVGGDAVGEHGVDEIVVKPVFFGWG